jgi:hypothetical protein
MCLLTNPDPMASPPSNGMCDCPGRNCGSGVDTCKPSKSNCYPPPDCPPTVRQAASEAQCLEATPLDVSDLNTCSCGYLGCAIACDGEGIVWGQSQTLVLALPASLPDSGSLGLMLRARGSGTLAATLNVSNGSQSMLDPVTLPADFADSLSGTLYSWTDNSGRPTSIELATDATSSVEVDCVVPYLAP